MAHDRDPAGRSDGLATLTFAGVQSEADIGEAAASFIRMVEDHETIVALCDWSKAVGWACEPRSLPVYEWVSVAGRIERAAIVHHHSLESPGRMARCSDPLQQRGRPLLAAGGSRCYETGCISRGQKMKLGMFMMPLHHPDKPWSRALAEDREAVIRADRLGFSEVWIGEHFSSKAEQIPSPMMFLASVLDSARSIRFGTGVIGLPHHNPIIVAAEAAMFDQLSGGRLMLGIGPGGLPSDAEMFGGREVAERYPMAMESLDIILQLWTTDAPFRIEGKSWEISLEKQIWPHAGVGVLTRPLQKPHPPIAMAMMGPGGRTAEIIAERDCIPISGNMVPLEIVAAQWAAYAAARDRLNQPADPDIWRVCRNILVTDSGEQARDALADPEGTLSYYFRYIRGVRRIAELHEFGHDRSLTEIDRLLGVAEAIDDCAIVGTADQVLDRLIAVVDKVGPFGSLIMIGHDWDQTNLWQSSMEQLATKVMPKLSQHASVARRH